MASVSYTFISQTNEKEDILDTFVTAIYPVAFFANDSDTVSQSLDASNGKITGTLVINNTTLTKSKPTENTNNIIITDPNLVQSLTLLASYSIPLTFPTNVKINESLYNMQSYMVINGKKYYYMVET